MGGKNKLTTDMEINSKEEQQETLGENKVTENKVAGDKGQNKSEDSKRFHLTVNVNRKNKKMNLC